MKRARITTTMITTMALALGLTGCGGAKTTETTEAVTQTEATTVEATTKESTTVEVTTEATTEEATTEEVTTEEPTTEAPATEAAAPAGDYGSYPNDKYAWWFVRNTDHTQSGCQQDFDFSQYGAYYLNRNCTDNVIYFTFDCGYENGYTNQILDILGANDVKAMFFVTKGFIKDNPDLVKRMKAEGHMVGNHTVTHPSMPGLSVDELKQEIQENAAYMKEATGYDMDPYLRPPMGEYSQRTLKLTQDMGYKTIFWSIAYLDYDVNNQPGKDYVVEHFRTYYHPGAIPLIHNVSQSNTEALQDVITLLRDNGYRFGTLNEL